jgi:hypothetical protein
MIAIGFPQINADQITQISQIEGMNISGICVENPRNQREPNRIR